MNSQLALKNFHVGHLRYGSRLKPKVRIAGSLHVNRLLEAGESRAGSLRSPGREPPSGLRQTPRGNPSLRVGRRLTREDAV